MTRLKWDVNGLPPANKSMAGKCLKGFLAQRAGSPMSSPYIKGNNCGFKQRFTNLWRAGYWLGVNNPHLTNEEVKNFIFEGLK